jgi:rhamnose transport system ATP-binding protein
VSTPLLEVRSIHKAFAGVQALNGVSFDVRPGEVHALVGENGAGKSTLIRIMTGAETPDAGTLLVDGQSLSTLDPASARAMGIAAIYQQPSLFPDLTVAENIALAIETGGPWRRVNRRARVDRARDLLERAGASIDPARLAATLSMPEQQLVEIARAIGADARIVIMDEPTASLGDHEVRRLFSVIRSLRDAGSAVIYISHRLDEVFEIADRVTVLRDGAAIATCRIADVDRAGLIAMMVGREVTQMYPKRDEAPSATSSVALELVRISNPGSGVRDVSLSIARGEIVGLAGLVGCGRSELAETIFGLTPARSGEIRIDGAVVRIDSPAQAIAHGMGYVPKDRRQNGVVPEMTVTENTGLASLKAVSRAGLIRPVIERRAAEGFIGQLRIKTPSASATVDTLSGGNQQKVALARWLMIDPRILILDEPTQGVDVGAKAEFHASIADLAARGVAILLISSELPELLGLCDRVAVMRAGTICGVLPGATATAPALLAMAVGQ